jgi:hypothetical protein
MHRNREIVFDSLRRLQRAWVSRGWSWDRRLDCAASTFDKTHAQEAATAIRASFPHQWTSATLRGAPEVIADVAEATGGVRSDQYLYTMDIVDGVLAYGLWWPWGGEGTNISLRVGLGGRASFDEQLELRKIFGALDD